MVVVMIPSNTLQLQQHLVISIDVSEKSFPNYVLKISGYIFRVRLL